MTRHHLSLSLKKMQTVSYEEVARTTGEMPWGRPAPGKGTWAAPRRHRTEVPWGRRSASPASLCSFAWRWPRDVLPSPRAPRKMTPVKDAIDFLKKTHSYTSQTFLFLLQSIFHICFLLSFMLEVFSQRSCHPLFSVHIWVKHHIRYSHCARYDP